MRKMGGRLDVVKDAFYCGVLHAHWPMKPFSGATVNTVTDGPPERLALPTQAVVDGRLKGSTFPRVTANLKPDAVRPCPRRPYLGSKREMVALSLLVANLAKAGVVEHLTREQVDARGVWISPAFAVPKVDDAQDSEELTADNVEKLYRLVVDERSVNSSVQDLLPNWKTYMRPVEACIYIPSRDIWYASVDVAQAFFNLEYHDDCADLFGFSYYGGGVDGGTPDTLRVTVMMLHVTHVFDVWRPPFNKSARQETAWKYDRRRLHLSAVFYDAFGLFHSVHSDNNTTLGAVPRTPALVAATRLLETAINEESGGSFFGRLGPLGVAFHDAYKEHETVVSYLGEDPLPAIEDHFEAFTTELHQSLAEELCYPYPLGDGGAPEGIWWLLVALKWCVIYTVVELSGKSITGRKELRDSLLVAVDAYRRYVGSLATGVARSPFQGGPREGQVTTGSYPAAAPSQAQAGLVGYPGLARAGDGAAPMVQVSIAPEQSGNAAGVQHGTGNDASLLSGHTSGTEYVSALGAPAGGSRDELFFKGHRRAKQLADVSGIEPFDGSGNDFILFIERITAALRSSPFCSGAARIEFVFLHLRNPALSAIRQSAAAAGVYALPDDLAYAKLIDILRDTYDSPLARKAAMEAWQSLAQRKDETVRSYINRFEEQRTLQEARVGKFDDLTLITKFSNGLTSAVAQAARAIADPLTSLTYHQYVQTVSNYSRSFEDARVGNPQAMLLNPTSTLTESARGKPTGNSRVQVMTATTQRAREKKGCYRCEGLGHMARNCDAAAPKDDAIRCQLCGAKSHTKATCPRKSQASSIRCKRCDKTGHCPGICHGQKRSDIALSGRGDGSREQSVVNNTLETVKNDDRDHSVNFTVMNQACDATYDTVCTTDSQTDSLSKYICTAPKLASVTVGKVPASGCTGNCFRTEALIDTGAGASFVSPSLVDFALKEGILSSNHVKEIPSIRVTYGNGQSALCTQAVDIPIRSFDLEGISAPVDDTLWLPCLIMPSKGRPMIIGRPAMSTLGLDLIFKSGTDIRGVEASSVMPQVGGPATVEASVRTLTFDIRDEENGIKRLYIRAPAFENASVLPFAEKARNRSVTDRMIIYERLKLMEAENKIERVSCSDAAIILEPVLVDKRGGVPDSPPRIFPDPQLAERYRITVDARVVNGLVPVSAGDGIQWVPRNDSAYLTRVDQDSYHQYQATPQEILQTWPTAATAFYGKLDLKDAFSSIGLPEAIRPMFCIRSYAIGQNGSTKIQLWRYLRLPQGWCWSPLYFSRGIQFLLERFSENQPEDVHIRHYQDDLLIGGSSQADVDKCLDELAHFLKSHGFQVNLKKSVRASRTIRFCGYEVTSSTYKPEPSRAELTETLVTQAWKDVTGFIERNRLAQVLKWLKSWAGRFQYLRGWLPPSLMLDLKVMYKCVKEVQKGRTISQPNEELGPSFFRLAQCVLGGNLPALTFGINATASFGSVLLVDANVDGWGAVVFRVEISAKHDDEKAQADDLLTDIPSTFSASAAEAILALRQLPYEQYEEKNALTLIPVSLFGNAWDVQSSRHSSTWRERAAQLLALGEAEPFLQYPTIVIGDNQNVGKEWHDNEVLFNGRWMRLLELRSRLVHHYIWVKRDGLPEMADSIARAMAQVANNGSESDRAHQYQIECYDDEVSPAHTPEDEEDNDVDDANTDTESVDSRTEPANNNEELEKSIGSVLSYLDKFGDSPGELVADLIACQSSDDRTTYLGHTFKDITAHLSAGEGDNQSRRRKRRSLSAVATRFALVHGILCYVVNNEAKICVPWGTSALLKSFLGTTVAPSWRSWVLSRYHDTFYGCHRGSYRLLSAVGLRYWWPSIIRDCYSFARSCLRCQCSKAVIKRHGGELSSTMMRASRPWELLIIDYCGPFEPDEFGRDYCLVCVDAYSRWLRLVPTRGCASSAAASGLWADIISLHGPPSCLHSDRGPSFVAGFLAEVEEQFGVSHTTSASRDPRVQGAAERAVREMKAIMKIVEHQLGTAQGWTTILPVIVMTHNFSPPPFVPAMCDLSPYMLMFGRPAPDIFMGGREMGMEVEAAGDDSTDGVISGTDYAKQINDKLKEVHEAWDLARTMEVSKRADRFRIGAEQYHFGEGDQVLRVTALEKPGGHKAVVTGPFTIKRKAGRNYYEVDGIDTNVPGHQLRPMITDPELRRGLPDDQRPAVILGGKNLIKVPLQELTPGTIIMFEVRSSPTQYYYDLAKVISNFPLDGKVNSKIMYAGPNMRWYDSDTAKDITYDDIVATGLVLTKDNRVPERILKLLAIRNEEEG
ncbi:hypothetical protein FOZ62_009794 [Perkinsus olseni]|uniref:Uncharacterized protein n=2 Tax=Perkinsus olseni TaxID=32597 RepID=A0A7J6S117_PEROL|nr:hypothetical protein FOZ62_009794 [Perkinsus olseni]